LALAYINAIVELKESAIPLIEDFKKLNHSTSFETFLKTCSTPLSCLKIKLINFLRNSQHLEVSVVLEKFVKESEWVVELCVIDFKVILMS
jgi:hypothetical protein